jgi:hypothetical protein
LRALVAQVEGLATRQPVLMLFDPPLYEDICVFQSRCRRKLHIRLHPRRALSRAIRSAARRQSPPRLRCLLQTISARSAGEVRTQCARCAVLEFEPQRRPSAAAAFIRALCGRRHARVRFNPWDPGPTTGQIAEPCSRIARQDFGIGAKASDRCYPNRCR